MRATIVKGLAAAGAVVIALAPSAAATTSRVWFTDDSPKCWAPPPMPVPQPPMCSVQLSVDGPQHAPIRLHARTRTVDGHPPVDYLPVIDEVVTIALGQAAAAALVELVPRPPLVGERFVLELFAPEGATLDETSVVVTITPDR